MISAGAKEAVGHTQQRKKKKKKTKKKKKQEEEEEEKKKKKTKKKKKKKKQGQAQQRKTSRAKPSKAERGQRLAVVNVGSSLTANGPSLASVDKQAQAGSW